MIAINVAEAFSYAKELGSWAIEGKLVYKVGPSRPHCLGGFLRPKGFGSASPSGMHKKPFIYCCY